jgi:hypothetical protein
MSLYMAVPSDVTIPKNRHTNNTAFYRFVIMPTYRFGPLPKKMKPELHQNVIHPLWVYHKLSSGQVRTFRHQPSE